MSSGLFHCPGVRREFWDFPAALRFFVPSRVPLNCPDTRCLVQTSTLVVIPGRWGMPAPEPSRTVLWEVGGHLLCLAR